MELRSLALTPKSRRSRVQILRRLERQNSVGELILNFEKTASVWAALKGDTVEMKYLGEIFPGWILKVNDRIYEVTSVVDKWDGHLRLVELGVRACAELPHVRPRWMATDGFLRREG